MTERNLHMGLVLIVEDDEAVREIFVTWIRSVGYEVIEATNGVHALEVLHHNQVGMIVTDLRMPLMDGVELVKRLKERDEWKAIPVVAVTATPSTGEMYRYFSGVLIKPCSFCDLITVVQGYMTRDPDLRRIL
ncbi:response regulator [Herbaspirillum sp. C7C8]|uniref:response regulator n=1 Tax=Herbaspirillum sp. C7C8 TaxID=2736665 RepID=UPI001F523D12|nr:response regulator [Herbaspirillum sp. C7C8]MCI1007367.1 response regulator [Herbaspirillum sp. C7C8]